MFKTELEDRTTAGQGAQPDDLEMMIEITPFSPLNQRL